LTVVTCEAYTRLHNQLSVGYHTYSATSLVFTTKSVLLALRTVFSLMLWQAPCPRLLDSSAKPWAEDEIRS